MPNGYDPFSEDPLFQNILETSPTFQLVFESEVNNDYLVLPYTSGDNYECYTEELGSHLEMISGRIVSEIRGRVVKIHYKYDCMAPDVWTKLASFLRSGVAFNVYYLSDVSGIDMMYDEFICESMTNPKFAFAQLIDDETGLSYPMWHDIEFTLRSVRPQSGGKKMLRSAPITPSVNPLANIDIYPGSLRSEYVFGKDPQKMQRNISIDDANFKITGGTFYIDDYTEFESENFDTVGVCDHGFYLVVNVPDEGLDDFSVTVDGKRKGDSTLVYEIPYFAKVSDIQFGNRRINIVIHLGTNEINYDSLRFTFSAFEHIPFTKEYDITELVCLPENPLSTLVVEALSTAFSETDLYGKKLSDLQSNIQVDKYSSVNYFIAGSVNYISDYTRFESENFETTGVYDHGYYLALRVYVPDPRAGDYSIKAYKYNNGNWQIHEEIPCIYPYPDSNEHICMIFVSNSPDVYTHIRFDVESSDNSTYSRVYDLFSLTYNNGR